MGWGVVAGGDSSAGRMRVVAGVGGDWGMSGGLGVGGEVGFVVGVGVGWRLNGLRKPKAL